MAFRHGFGGKEKIVRHYQAPVVGEASPDPESGERFSGIVSPINSESSKLPAAPRKLFI
jgi:hypothetical protein